MKATEAARIMRAIDYHRDYMERAASEGHDIDASDFAALEQAAAAPGFARETEAQVETDIAAAIGAYGYQYVLAIVRRIGRV